MSPLPEPAPTTHDPACGPGWIEAGPALPPPDAANPGASAPSLCPDPRTGPTGRGVQLQYRFGATAQAGCDIEHALFDLLSAMAGAGSVQAADGLTPRALDISTTENNHLAAATVVAGGAADAALGLEAAVARCGLAFVPLAEEDCYLACLADALEQPAVTLLRQLLGEAAWGEALAHEPGYPPAAQHGAVLSLTRALPWWNFDRRTPGRSLAASPP